MIVVPSFKGVITPSLPIVATSSLLELNVTLSYVVPSKKLILIPAIYPLRNKYSSSNWL